MDRRGWLWKKKSSEKNRSAEKPVAESEYVGPTLSSVAQLGDQDNCNIRNYVQISVESYTRMCGLEDQILTLEDQVKALEAKLSAAYSELNNKDNLVKQHAKVAEEAVSGWEKADAEVVSLRRQLENVTLSKLTVDDRASHLDGALKECMRQIRTVKEESEQKLQEVILMKSKQWEKNKLELEAKIDKLNHELLQAAGENAALLRSLQESSNKIVKIQEEKSEVGAEVELLKKNVESYEKEITSLTYELHIVSKEMDIRNEEKDMIMRSAEVTNKQHIQDVKHIAKLEAELQRLRGLLRKKLPGPAALARMKLEVESSHQVISEPHLRKTCLKTDNLQGSDFLAKQLVALEEETKTLKEALATCNAELQASRKLYTKTVGRLKSLEAEVQVFHQERSSPKSILVINAGNSSSIISNNPSSITSISDDGHEDAESLVESCAASIPDLSDIRSVKSVGKFEKDKSETFLELMNDFLEVEKMACLSDNGNVDPGIIGKVNNSRKRDFKGNQSDDTHQAGDLPCKQQSGLGFSSNQNRFDVTFPPIEPEDDSDCPPILKRLQSIISMISNSEIKDSNIRKLFEDLQGTVHELRDYYLPRTSEEFSASLNQFMTSKTSLEFVLKLSQALTKSIEWHLNYLDCKGKRVDVNSSNGINTLVPNDLTNEMCVNKDGCFPQLSSNSDIPREELSPGSEFNYISYKYPLEEFKQKESEKDDKAAVNAEYAQDLKETKLVLQEKVQLLAELETQLASSHKSYSLAEVQLKCMTESYKKLEAHVEELEAENKFLKEKMEELRIKLAEEKQCHHDALVRYNEIEEKMQRDQCLVCASNSTADNGVKTGKDTELAAAEKKLAECQETLYLLSRQLQALCPKIDITMSHHSKRLQQMNEMLLVKPSQGCSKSYGSYNSNEIDQAEACSVSSDIQGTTDEFSSHNCGSTSCPSDTEGSFSLNSSVGSSQPAYMLAESNSYSGGPAAGKHAHGLSHFFSSKGKTSH